MRKVNGEEATPQSDIPPWLVVASVAVVAVTVGLGVGFVVGHRKGRADNETKLHEAQAKAEAAVEHRSQQEGELSTARSEKRRVAQELEAVKIERDYQLVKLKEQSTTIRSLELMAAKYRKEKALADQSVRALEKENSQSKSMLKLIAAEEEKARKRQADLKSVVAKTRAELRQQASDKAVIRIKEYYLLASREDQNDITLALLELRAISSQHNKGGKVVVQSTLRSVLRQCVSLVRVGGDFIPPESKYTFAESWEEALKAQE